MIFAAFRYVGAFGVAGALLVTGLASAAAGFGRDQDAASAAGLPGGPEMLAHPRLTASVGPFPRATLVLTHERDGGSFSGRLEVPVAAGRPHVIQLPKPDGPEEFFTFDVLSVLFTPIGHAKGNTIVVLYRTTQIGPQHDPEYEALVYRVGPKVATRLAMIERKLAGVRDAKHARRRLALVS